jgi:hypothetical protein
MAMDTIPLRLLLTEVKRFGERLQQVWRLFHTGI